jgi:transcriptional regulator with XRE-family HTH domain
VSMSQLIAYNTKWFRTAAGMSQEELGEPLGWSAASVSAAERSWESKRVKRFDADEIMQIASALAVPVPALFLPPEDAGTKVNYVLQLDPRDEKGLDAQALVGLLFPSFDGDSPVMEAFRRRMMAAGATKLASNVARRWDYVAGVPEEIRAALIRQHEELEGQIDDLRAFERSYREKLQAYLIGQLRDLWEGASPTEGLAEELRRQAAESAAPRVSALILRDDGTYDLVQPGAADSQED